MSIEQRSLGAWFIQNRPALVALYAQINHFNPSAHGIPPEAWRAAMRGLNHPANLVPTEALRRLACPVLLVVGHEDPIVPLDIVQEVAALIPQAEVAVVEQAAHSAYFEQPEVFNLRLLAFLQGLPVSGAMCWPSNSS